jgi:Mycothiol maleylpyruvate isomerase N-terminal domain
VSDPRGFADNLRSINKQRARRSDTVMSLGVGEFMGLREMIVAERADLVEFLRTLSGDDWLVPSLCEGWRVRDVVAHLQVDTVSVAQYLALPS